MSLDTTGKEKSLQLLFQIEIPAAITSIHIETIPSPAYQQQFALPSSTPSPSTATPTGASTGTPGGTTHLKVFILLATSQPTRLYHFLGSTSLPHLFQSYSRSGHSSFIELPGNMRHSSMHLYYSSPHASAQHFVMASQLGVYHGNLQLDTAAPRREGIVSDAHLIAYDAYTDLSSPAPGRDAVAVTEFHCLVLRDGRLTALSAITGALVQNESVDSLIQREGSFPGDRGHTGVGHIPLGLAEDRAQQTIWLYTPSDIFQVTSESISVPPSSGKHAGGLGSRSVPQRLTVERAEVWTAYLSRARTTADLKYLDLAMNYCYTDEQRAIITREQASFLVNKGMVSQAAPYLARTGTALAPFEDVAAWLLQRDEQLAEGDVEGNFTSSSLSQSALLAYLDEKLALLPPSAKASKTLVGTWLAEKLLNGIAVAALEGDAKAEVALTTKFKEFIRSFKGLLDGGTLKGLVATRGTPLRPLLLHLLVSGGDIEGAVQLLVDDRRYTEALSLLSTDIPRDHFDPILHRNLPTLLLAEPEATVGLLLAKGPLRFERLLPAILTYIDRIGLKNSGVDVSGRANDKEIEVNYVTLYMQTVAERSLSSGELPDPLLLRTLLWQLLAAAAATTTATSNNNNNNNRKSEKVDPKSRIKPDEEPVLTFLNLLFEQNYYKKLLYDMDFDFQYILRLAQHYNCTRTAILLYETLEDYEIAVEVALEYDVEVAKEVIKKIDDGQRSKRLWLKLAEHLLSAGEGSDDAVKAALQLIHDGDGAVTVEDILPMLPDSADLSLFRHEVCRALDGNRSSLASLQSRMDDTGEAAEDIIRELDAIRSRGYTFTTNQRCEFCRDVTLCAKPFYIFPCGHGVHTDCTQKHTFPYLSEAQQAAVRVLEENIRSVVNLRSKDTADRRTNLYLEQLQNDLDDVLASDCPLCGDVMIRSLGLSLILQPESEEAKSWEL